MLKSRRRPSVGARPLHVRPLSVSILFCTFAGNLKTPLIMARFILNFDNIVAVVRFVLSILPDIVAAVEDLKDDGQLNGSTHEDKQ